MSTNLTLPDFETCRVQSIDSPAKREKAIECYSKFIEEAEKSLQLEENADKLGAIRQQVALGYNERGFLKYQQVEFKEAIKDYTDALSFNNQLHFTFYNRGLVHYRLGRFDQAIEDMNQALHLHTDFEPAVKCLEAAQKEKQNKDTTVTKADQS